jgi:hypothetical protein
LHVGEVVAPTDGTQLPATHPMPVPHAFPHEPQLLLSFCLSTHEPAQALSPGRQPDAHAPLEHTWSGAHCTPHPPQLFGSWLTGMHFPPQYSW